MAFLKISNNNIHNNKTLSQSFRTTLKGKVYKELGLHTCKPQLGKKNHIRKHTADINTYGLKTYGSSFHSIAHVTEKNTASHFGTKLSVKE